MASEVADGARGFLDEGEVPLAEAVPAGTEATPAAPAATLGLEGFFSAGFLWADGDVPNELMSACLAWYSCSSCAKSTGSKRPLGEARNNHNNNKKRQSTEKSQCAEAREH